MSIETTWTERNEVPGLIRLWGCDKNHRPVTFMGESIEACPACEIHKVRKMCDEEVQYFINSASLYKGIVHKIGKLFGEAARTSDDGSVQDTVLALKVYPLVRDLVNQRKDFNASVRQTEGEKNEYDRFYPSSPGSGIIRTKVRRRRRDNSNPRPRPRRDRAGTVLAIGAVAGFLIGVLKGGKE